MSVPNFLLNIDWVELRKQKLVLLDSMNHIRVEDIEAIESIVCVIDAMQDYAVDDLGINKDDVFGEDYVEYDGFDDDNKILDVFNETPQQIYAKELAEMKYIKGIEQHEAQKIVSDPYVCPTCGGTNVERKIWADANTSVSVGGENPEEADDCYCRDCNTHEKLILRSEFDS